MSIILKNFIVLLVAILLGGLLYSQNYQPFPTENAIWREESGGGYGNNNCTDYHYIITGDTIVNGYTYSKLQVIGVWYYPDMFGCTSQIQSTFNAYKGAIRNDSANRKVYILPKGSDEDTLFYDFNLSVGQILPQTYAYFTWDGSILRVNGIDSILIENTYHKRYFIGDTTSPTWYYVEIIEGIGSTFGLFGNLTYPYEDYWYLLCFMRDGYTVYPYVGYSCDLVTSIAETEEDECILQAHPNPFTTSTTFEYELTEPSCVQLTIYNAIGEEVYRAEGRLMAEGKHSIIWSADHLPEGLYYAVIRSEEEVSVVKMIKQ